MAPQLTTWLMSFLTLTIFRNGQQPERILVAQALYAVGAAMCLVNTYVSIGFIVFVQLNFAIAPRIFRLNRF
ncbi:MAG: hypothetical protein ABSB67_24500 [Bryobacteraceae bacterium]